MLSEMNGVAADTAVVSFDFDDTLVDESHYVISRWQSAILSYDTEMLSLFHEIPRVVERLGPKSRQTIDEALLSSGCDMQHKKSLLEAFKYSIGSDSFLPGATEVLAAIRSSRFRVGLITDGFRELQLSRLTRLDIHEYLDFYYFGDEVQKPDPMALGRCITDERIEASQLIHVGNDFERDALAARAVGAVSVLIGKSVDKRFEPQIYTFGNLLDFSYWLEKNS